MFQNYLKTAIRSLLRNKLFSAINIVGLSIGLAAFILIMLFVNNEFSWDSHWSRSEDIYRLENTYIRENQPDRPSPNAVDPLKEIFFSTFREVEDITRYIQAGLTVRSEDNLFSEQVMIADHNFFDFFEVTFLEGSRDTAFNDLASAVISERTAKKYFGDEPALGKVLKAGFGSRFMDFRVSGVIADPTERSVLQSDFLVPFVRDYFVGARWFTEDWRFAIRQTFVRFEPNTDMVLIRSALPDIIDQYLPKQVQGQENGRHWSMKLRLVPIEDVHLYGNGSNADPDLLFGFVGIALLILIIAVVNFLNLSMARTAHRAREVAMRKVVGASRSQIIQQFLGESVLLAFIALLLALVMVEFALPYYNEFLSSVTELDVIRQPAVIATIVLLGIGVGLSAGSFQATYFALLKPRDVLYSNTAADNGTSKLRLALVVAQFSISVALMIIAFYVNKQTEFARELDLGFNAEDLLVVSGTNNDRSEAIKQRLLASPYITAVGRSSDVPTEGSEDRLHIRPVTGGEPVMLDGLPTGPDFFKAYEIPLLAGRYLTDVGADVLRSRTENPEYAAAANIVINDMGAKLLGFSTPEAAVGQQVSADLSSSLRVDATIVGVVANFHFDSARDVIRPGVYYVDFVRNSDMSVRIDGRNREAAVQAIEEAWSATYPDSLMRYRSMADLVERQYQTDDRLGDVLVIFTLLAVLISSMGLYGLASFTAERRTKEIGIRKVLGAGISDLLALLLWQFSKPILVANLIAWPVSFYFLNDWLSGFAYRVELGALPFVLLGMAALLIGWLTVASHAVGVARSSPIKALRHE